MSKTDQNAFNMSAEIRKYLATHPAATNSEVRQALAAKHPDFDFDRPAFGPACSNARSRLRANGVDATPPARGDSESRAAAAATAASRPTRKRGRRTQTKGTQTATVAPRRTRKVRSPQVSSPQAAVRGEDTLALATDFVAAAGGLTAANALLQRLGALQVER